MSNLKRKVQFILKNKPCNLEKFNLLPDTIIQLFDLII